MFVPWYLPGELGGGSMRSVVSAVRTLREECDFSIVTSDRDLGADEPYPHIRNDSWNTLPDGTRVFYCSRSGRTPKLFAQLIRDELPDFVYINSIFSYSFSILPLSAARRVLSPSSVIVAPRGMLDPIALRQKARKKRIFLRALRMSGLHAGITWHASSPNEASAIRAVAGTSARIAVAMDLARPAWRGFVSKEKRPGDVRLFFLSRIVSNKNLLGAIEMVKRVDKAHRVHLDVFGPVEDAPYWKRCRDEMRTTPEHVTIEYHGAIEHSAIPERLGTAHFLLLPTRFENFGHVILESLAMCCPVIASDQTPWRDLERQQLGWDLPLSDPDAFVRAIEEAAKMDAVTYRAWSKAAFAFAERHVSDDTALRAHRAMFATPAGAHYVK